MSTVDLEALRNSLRSVHIGTAIVSCVDGTRYLSFGIGSSEVIVWDTGEVKINGWIVPTEAIGLLARHLDPPVARPELRERCAKAIHRFDESIGEVPADWPEHWSELKSGVRKVYLLRADAVIAALSEVDHG